MCVILVAKDRVISPNEVEQAARVNSDGIGMAWFKRGRVRWRKGLSVDEAMWLCGRVPRPYVFHARLATVGSKTDSLSHPFPVVREPVEGKTGISRRVLFHNGHVSEWYSLALAAGVRLGEAGSYSDSSIVARVLATIDRRWRVKLLEQLSGKWVLMGDGGVTCVGQFIPMKGVLASNDRFTCGKGRYAGWDWFRQGKG